MKMVDLKDYIDRESLVRWLEGVLGEDIGGGDITTDLLIKEGTKVKGMIICKEAGVLAGLEVAKFVFELADSSVSFLAKFSDGACISEGDVICEVEGLARALLLAERTAINILSHLCAIATKAKRLTDKVKKYNVEVYDTRKTLPGLRALQKYAVRVGGAKNHRFNLSQILIKDNHIKIVGDIKEAIKLAKLSGKEVYVEISNIDQIQSVINLEPDLIMLDNFQIPKIEEAVKLIKKDKSKILIEVSGGIDEENIEEYARLGVDRISVGALTHSVKALDLSFKICEP